MTVAAPSKGEDILEKVTDERPMEYGECEVTLSRNVGVLAPNLQLGSDLTSCAALIANSMLAHRGVQTIGSGFIITPAEAESLGLGTQPGIENHIRGYRNGRDLGERLDAHRKRQQELHPGLTLTGMYNVLEILRAGEPLTAKG